MWILAGLLSAVFLGVYDVFKKLSVNNNAVIPVLLGATVAGALPFVPLIFISHISPISASQHFWYVPELSVQAHLHFLLKATIVSASWIFTYFAMKHLPLTIISPIRSSAPVWTILGGILIYGERLGLLQWAGVAVVMACYYVFSIAGRHEGIEFKTNRWIFFVFLATLLGSISGLYDKFLVSHYPRFAMQAWCSIYMVAVLLPVLLIFWLPTRKRTTAFEWRWTIPAIGLFLIVADFVYFYALSQPGSMVSLVTVLRRTSGVYSFVIGAVLFRETNIRFKAWVLLGIFIGILLIMAGS